MGEETEDKEAIQAAQEEADRETVKQQVALLDHHSEVGTPSPEQLKASGDYSEEHIARHEELLRERGIHPEQITDEHFAEKSRQETLANFANYSNPTDEEVPVIGAPVVASVPAQLPPQENFQETKPEEAPAETEEKSGKKGKEK